MNNRAERVKDIIVSQLTNDGLFAEALVSSCCGDESINSPDIVTIEVTILKNIKAVMVVKVLVEEQRQVKIHFKSIIGVIGTDDMINLSKSLNNAKSNVMNQF